MVRFRPRPHAGPLPRAGEGVERSGGEAWIGCAVVTACQGPCDRPAARPSTRLEVSVKARPSAPRRCARTRATGGRPARRRSSATAASAASRSMRSPAMPARAAIAVGGRMQHARGRVHLAPDDLPLAIGQARDAAGEARGEALLHLAERQRAQRRPSHSIGHSGRRRRCARPAPGPPAAQAGTAAAGEQRLVRVAVDEALANQRSTRHRPAPQPSGEPAMRRTRQPARRGPVASCIQAGQRQRPRPRRRRARCCARRCRQHERGRPTAGAAGSAGRCSRPQRHRAGREVAEPGHLHAGAGCVDDHQPAVDAARWRLRARTLKAGAQQPAAGLGRDERAAG